MLVSRICTGQHALLAVGVEALGRAESESVKAMVEAAWEQLSLIVAGRDERASQQGKKVGAGRRGDGTFITPDVAGVERTHLFDTTIISNFAKATLGKSREWASNTIDSITSPNTNAVHVVASPALAAQVARKYDHYNPILLVSQQQVSRKERETEISFTPAAISAEGAFSVETDAIVETIVSAFRVRTTRDHGAIDDWGASVASRTAGFRTRLQTQLVKCAVLGTARMMRVAGLPWARAGGSIL